MTYATSPIIIKKNLKLIMDETLSRLLSSLNPQCNNPDMTKYLTCYDTSDELLQMIEKVKQLDTNHFFQEPLAAWEKTAKKKQSIDKPNS